MDGLGLLGGRMAFAPAGLDSMHNRTGTFAPANPLYPPLPQPYRDRLDRDAIAPSVGPFDLIPAKLALSGLLRMMSMPALDAPASAQRTTTTNSAIVHGFNRD